MFFFLGARVYTLGAGVALCFIYIYIYIMCIYILYFFWLGLFLIQSYTMVASPSLKECLVLMLENEVEGKVGVSTSAQASG